MFIEPKLKTIKSTKFMKNKKLEEITYTCSAACWTKKEILNRSWDKMVIELSAIWDKKELQEGKLNSMGVKLSNCWSDIIFWNPLLKIFNTSKNYG